MRIPSHVVDRLRAAIEPLDTESTRAMYRAGEIPRSASVKDLDKRYRWDLAYAAIGSAGICQLYDDHGANDSHIDTALRRIVAPL